MRIKTRIQLGIILSLVLAATIALLLFHGTRAVNEASRLEGIAVEVVKGVAELKIVTHEYLLHPEERSLMQWRSRYGSLSKLLTGGHFKSPGEKIVADQIFKDLERVKTVFFDLTTGLRNGDAPGKQGSADFRELHDRLMGDLLVKSQAAVSLAFQLQEEIEAKLVATQKTVSLLTILLLLTLTAIIVGISLWINRSIARPIAKLEGDTQIIGNGNLDYKVGTMAKDEIGQLSRAFDKMTGDLKKSTASIAELNKEIIERKQTEEALRDSRNMMQAVLDSIPSAVFWKDRDSIYLGGNRTWLEAAGLRSLEEVLGKSDYDLPWEKEQTDSFREDDMRVMESGIPEYGIVEPYLRADGTHAWARTNKVPLRDKEGNVTGVLGTYEDITEQVQAEEALRESEERFRALFEQAAVGVGQIETETGRFLRINQKYCDIAGYTFEEMSRISLMEITHPDDVQHSLDNIKRLVSGEIRDSTIEKRYIRKDGSVVWVNLTISPMWSIDEKPNYHIAVAQDITDRKLAEKSLRDSEEKFSRLFFSSPTWVTFSKLEDGTYLEVNDAFGESTGFDRKDVIGRTSVEFGLWPDPRERERFKKLAQDEGGFRTQEVTFLTKKGDPLTILWSADVIELDGEACLLSTAMDISELKQAEQEKIKLQDQLHRAQKMESMGLLAGGVAHDLNNILSGIVSYPDLLLMRLPEDSPLRKPIKTMQESGMKAADVVADLLTIARGVAIAKKALNLNTVIQEYLSSAEHEKLEAIRPSVTFKSELDPELLNIIGSPSHVNKTLMNLVANASDAIEGTGTVAISSANRYIDEPLKGYEDVRTGEYVVLTVSDDGSGIFPEELERIFEPFYIKKVMGRSGTGLGLAVVWNTVQDHRGYINVESSEKGTIFELYFPVSRKEVAAEKERVPLEDYLGNGEKILVVDDEERQREIACGLLTELNYDAVEVSSGEEAIEYVKEQPVDLIVLDMVMPKGINSRETYEEIIKIRPGQKAIIASGYAKTKEVETAQELGAGNYIKKPYTMEKVGLAVKVELEK